VQRPSPKQIRIGLAGLLAVVLGLRLCTKGPSAGTPAPATLVGPIAAALADAGEVVVAVLDVPAKAIRVRRVNAKDEVVAERLLLDDLAPSQDSELKVAASGEGAAITWRGLRGGKLVRQLVLVGRDLEPKGDAVEVNAASCATRDAVWSSDGSRATARAWGGAVTKIDLPKDKDVSLLCGTHRAYAILDDDERTSILPLASDKMPIAVLREKDFGEDEQRELAEYTIGEDVGVVRLAASGTVSFREIAGGALGPLHTLKTQIPKDDDLVAVDASPRTLAIVYTQDASASCSGDNPVSTKVTVLRVDRQSLDESIVELSPGKCGHEVGPFFTGTLGDGVSLAWAERAGGAGRARAPVVGLAHATLPPTDKPPVESIAVPSQSLVDAMCDSTTCYAAAVSDEKLRVLRYR
jgi:hypothetical protein